MQHGDIPALHGPATFCVSFRQSPFPTQLASWMNLGGITAEGWEEAGGESSHPGSWSPASSLGVLARGMQTEACLLLT